MIPKEDSPALVVCDPCSLVECHLSVTMCTPISTEFKKTRQTVAFVS